MVLGSHALAIGPLIYASVKIDEMFQMTTYHSFT